MSPQQIQLMKLMQVPAMQLEQRVKEEIEQNPALEEGSDEDDDFLDVSPTDSPDISAEPESTASDAGEEEIDDSSQFEDAFEMSDYYDESDEGVAEYKLKDPGEWVVNGTNQQAFPVANSRSFQEILEEQLVLLDLTERDLLIARQLLGSLDDDGYLRRDWEALCDDLWISDNLQTNPAELQSLLRLIQTFDPPGIGATSLQECLLLQLDRKENNPIIRVAKKLVTEHFDAFTRKHFDKIQESLDLDDEELRIVLEEITSLNPKPGGAITNWTDNKQYIIPDFVVSQVNGELLLSLHQANMPELRISQHFKDMLKDYKRSKVKKQETREALLFIKQKIESARWFMDAIKQRQETLLNTMQVILTLQQEFFLTGAESTLRPMILKDIADKTGLDVSTISRVANSKYVQTEWGTLPLKFFFSEGMKNEQGEEVSTREVKNVLAELIASEDKRNPLSDEELMEKLKANGFSLARRTVAKYREQLGLPVGRLRKGPG